MTQSIRKVGISDEKRIAYVDLFDCIIFQTNFINFSLHFNRSTLMTQYVWRVSNFDIRNVGRFSSFKSIFHFQESFRRCGLIGRSKENNDCCWWCNWQVMNVIWSIPDGRLSRYVEAFSRVIRWPRRLLKTLREPPHFTDHLSAPERQQNSYAVGNVCGLFCPRSSFWLTVLVRVLNNLMTSSCRVLDNSRSLKRTQQNCSSLTIILDIFVTWFNWLTDELELTN